MNDSPLTNSSPATSIGPSHEQAIDPSAASGEHDEVHFPLRSPLPRRGSSAQPVEVRLPGVGPRLLGIGLLVIVASAIILFGARSGEWEDFFAPVPVESR